MVKIVLSFLLGLTSCAYNISSDKKQLPGGYDQAFLPPFTNHTRLPGIETYFTNSLGREIQRSAVAKVSNKMTSQVTIEGAINNLQFVAGSPTTPKALEQLPPYTSLFVEYRIFVEATVSVRRNSDSQVIWTGKVKGEKSYTAPQVASAGVNSINPLYNHSARHQQISQLAQDMMIEAVDRMTEQF